MTPTLCCACGSPVEETWLENCQDYYLETGYVVNYLVCRNCDLVQQVPLPADPSIFYPASYPMHSSRGSIRDLLRRLLVRNVYFVPPAAGRNVFLFDFGCGDGSYIQSVRERVDRVAGFEFSHHQAERLSAHLDCNVYSRMGEASQELAGQVDCVTAHFVLEHLTDLHGTFGFWEQIMKPGGTLHLAVPNIRSWEATLFGRMWHGLDPPRHICFPDERSLTPLIERYGFRIVAKGCGTFPNSLAASIATCLAGRYHHLLFSAFIPLAFLLSLLFPQGVSVYTLSRSSSPADSKR